MPPLVVLVGETASGKSALALELAERVGGEIICADSRTVYKGMDIGTAKPTPAERARVPHYGLDEVTPDKSFSAAAFQRLATDAITDISSRGKLPIMVGGTGLYIDSVLFGFEFRAPADPAERERLQAMSIAELQAEIAEKGLPMPENRQNKRHLTRLLEAGVATAIHKTMRPHTLVLGLSIDRNELRQRIAARTDAMLQAGFVEEVRRLGEQYGFEVPGLQAPGYKAFHCHLTGELSLEQARDEFIKNDLALAKRQRTWFKRNSSIQWLNDRSNAVDIVTTFLNKTN